jgi:hypothetical protein
MYARVTTECQGLELRNDCIGRTSGLDARRRRRISTAFLAEQPSHRRQCSLPVLRSSGRPSPGPAEFRSLTEGATSRRRISCRPRLLADKASSRVLAARLEQTGRRAGRPVALPQSKGAAALERRCPVAWAVARSAEGR